MSSAVEIAMSPENVGRLLKALRAHDVVTGDRSRAVRMLVAQILAMRGEFTPSDADMPHVAHRKAAAWAMLNGDAMLAVLEFCTEDERAEHQTVDFGDRGDPVPAVEDDEELSSADILTHKDSQ